MVIFLFSNIPRKIVVKIPYTCIVPRLTYLTPVKSLFHLKCPHRPSQHNFFLMIFIQPRYFFLLFTAIITVSYFSIFLLLF